MKRQPPPGTLKLELVEGCSLYCAFCGIRGIRERAGGPYNYLSIETAGRVAHLMAKAGWDSRIEMAMRGEPTLHPHLLVVIGGLRRVLPNSSLMMTSNGTGLIKSHEPGKTVLGMFRAGLNCLVLDNYEGVSAVTRVVDDCVRYGIRAREYPSDADANPYRRWAANVHELVVFPDIRKTTAGVHSVSDLSNHCGAAAPLNSDRAGKRCARPFRELVVRWDGRVPLCCNDWRGVVCAGNIGVAGIDDIWQGPIFQAARRMLFDGRREVPPCLGCDSISKRVACISGYPRGERPPAATNDDVVFLSQQVCPPMTPAVLRDWEKP